MNHIISPLAQFNRKEFSNTLNRIQNKTQINTWASGTLANLLLMVQC
jgi:hypothetical protein